HNSLNTRAIVSNEPVITNAVTTAPATKPHTHVGPNPNKFIPLPTATRSAATFNVLARINTATKTVSTRFQPRLKRLTANSPSPVPVAKAVRSHISCTADINGSVSSDVHSNPYPKEAPACE